MYTVVALSDFLVRGNNVFEAKYLDVADELESRIDDCQWESKLPGVAVLSKELGVNSRTVSKALRALSLRGKVTIKPYSGTFICRDRKASEQHKVIGVLGLMVGEKRVAGLDEIEERAKGDGYHVLNVEHCGEIFEKKPAILSKLPVDGFVFTNSLLTTEMVRILSRESIPFVSVNRISDMDGVSWVDFDNEKAHREMLEHLLSLGHRRIAYVAFHEQIEEHSRRMMNVYKSVLQPKGLYDPSLYIHDGDMNGYYQRYADHYCSIYGMEKASYLMGMENKPTAVVCCGKEIAHGFCCQVRQMGMSVPENVSVVSTGEDHKDAEMEPFLTMIAGSVRKRAARATEILLQLIDDPKSGPVQEFVDMDLLLRDSVSVYKG